jgi:hypothetical protein
MTDQQIIEVIEGAIYKAVELDIKLLSAGGVENTFAATLRDLLLPAFKTDQITVDINYNKHNLQTKMLDGRRIELDIAIHQRHNDTLNTVAIELETANYPKRDDVWKLIDLTGDVDGYGYRLGLFFVVGVKNQAGEIIEMTWYKDGEIKE